MNALQPFPRSYEGSGELARDATVNPRTECPTDGLPRIEGEITNSSAFTPPLEVRIEEAVDHRLVSTIQKFSQEGPVDAVLRNDGENERSVSSPRRRSCGKGHEIHEGEIVGPGHEYSSE